MVMALSKTPGVYKETLLPAQATELRTGVPAFLGLTTREPAGGGPQLLTLPGQFATHFGKAPTDSYLAAAVQGFFENGGRSCYVLRLDPERFIKAAEAAGQTLNPDAALETALAAALAQVAALDAVDLVCAPDLMRPREGGALPPDPQVVVRMQQALLAHCDSLNDRFAILDALPDSDSAAVLQQRALLASANGALYYPWLRVPNGPAISAGFVPPCGHVAGVYSRTDQREGVHKAPANELLEGVLDLKVNLTALQQEALNPAGVNCLRAFPGRGLRVWGARTLSPQPAWRYVNVRRLFLAVGRWIERNMATVVFEANDVRLWARIRRELTAYFTALFQRGALQGRSAQEAFYVQCDAQTNPPEVRNAGLVVTEIGLAPVVPGEFIVVRIVYSAGGLTLTGPAASGVGS